jgi:hypothetical protein
MTRLLGLALLFAIVLYGIWPYTTILWINQALEDSDTQALAPLVDLAAIQNAYKARVNRGVDRLLPAPSGRQTDSRSGSAAGAADDTRTSDPDRANADSASQANAGRGESPMQIDADRLVGWLGGAIKQFGDSALDQAISLDWVRATLLSASRRAQGPTSTSFIGAVDFAFFESWNRFVVRLGKLGADPTFIILSLEGSQWRITDITG